MRGVQRLTSRSYADPRGRFIVAWEAALLAELEGWSPFVQESLSESHHNVLRGLHMQHPRQQGKLIRVVSGAIFDVVVDLRPGSETFCQWRAHHLDAASADALWVPPGLAHGFLVLSAAATVLYQVTAPWDPGGELVVCWSDPSLGIDWPQDGPPTLSARDASAPPLAQVLKQLPLH